MKKVMYSLMLSSNVIEQIDRLAYEQGLSRSQMINLILARYAGMQSPEHRVQSIFDAAAQLLDTQSQLCRLPHSAQGVLALRSALQYKYNPTMRYQLELNPHEGSRLGILRVSLRTQNSSLCHSLSSFYQLWQALERQHLPNAPACEIQGTRCLRPLLTPPGRLQEHQLAQAVTDYLQLFDECLKYFFSCPDASSVHEWYVRQLPRLTWYI